MPVSEEPPSLFIDLQFYKGHKALLSSGVYKALGTVERVEKFQEKGTVPLSDFLNYFLIHRALNSAYGTFKDRLKKLSTAVTMLEDVIDTNGTVRFCPGSDTMQEHLGETVSLSVANILFDVTAADWAKIPEQKGPGANKTFDYEKMFSITSAGDIIQIESKGTFVPDNTIPQDNVRNHASILRVKSQALTMH